MRIHKILFYKLSDHIVFSHKTSFGITLVKLMQMFGKKIRREIIFPSTPRRCTCWMIWTPQVTSYGNIVHCSSYITQCQ